MVKLNFDKITYVESLKDYLKIHTKEMYYVTHMTMKKMEETLLSEVFIRIHKSYILSLSGLKSFEGNTVVTFKESLPVYAIYKEHFIKTVFRINT